ncbi:MAG: type II secretion system F family protein [Dermatophilaceae bacterium]
MSLVVALLAMVGCVVWPGSFRPRSLAILPRDSTLRPPTTVRASARAPSWEWIGHRWPLHGTAGISSLDLLTLLESIAPALEAGIAPASALQIAADSRSDPTHLDPLEGLVRAMAAAAADGDKLGPLWREAAGAAGSAELLLLAQAWSLTEDMGAPLAQAVRTAAGLIEARIAQERRLTAALAGARATVNVLTVLPLGGPLVALFLGIGPGELYGGSPLTGGSLALGLVLAGLGRLWVRRMLAAVARGPLVS